VSIQRAIERAIAAAKEKEAHEEVQRAPARASAPATTGAAAAVVSGSLHRKQTEAAPKPVLKKIAFPRCELDLQTCIQNRILIPGGDAALEARGSASYRMLRTRVLQRARANRWTAIGFTSPGPSEGKSLTCINLALSIAREMNNNVFLIDLDLRNPSVNRYLGVAEPPSIADYLSGATDVDNALYSIGVENLLVAGANTGTSHSSELIAAGRHTSLFSHIASISTQPLIIVDLPPVLSTDEALVLAPQLDAIFLVVGEGTTRRDGLVRSVDLLQEFNLAGIILNKSRGVGQDYYAGAYDAP
jgi:protein-tyrosine kinase